MVCGVDANRIFIHALNFVCILGKSEASVVQNAMLRRMFIKRENLLLNYLDVGYSYTESNAMHKWSHEAYRILNLNNFNDRILSKI